MKIYMPGNYNDQIISEVARIAREYGKTIKEALETGEPTPGKHINLVVY